MAQLGPTCARSGSAIACSLALASSSPSTMSSACPLVMAALTALRTVGRSAPVLVSCSCASASTSLKGLVQMAPRHCRQTRHGHQNGETEPLTTLIGVRRIVSQTLSRVVLPAPLSPRRTRRWCSARSTVTSVGGTRRRLVDDSSPHAHPRVCALLLRPSDHPTASVRRGGSGGGAP